MLNSFENKILLGSSIDILKEMPDESIDCVVTSPPYWSKRNYEGSVSVWDGDKHCDHNWYNFIKKPSGGKGSKTAKVGANKNDEANMRDKEINCHFCKKCGAYKGQLGLEPKIELFIKHLCDIFDEVKRVLKNTGTIFVNIGDTYKGGNDLWKHSGYPDKKFNKGRTGNFYEPNQIEQKNILPKSLCMIPERFAIEMIDRGWILRNNIVWVKKYVNWKNRKSSGSAMPHPAKDRLSNNYEYIYFFTKSQKYYSNLDKVRIPHKASSIKRTKSKWEGHREEMSSFSNLDIKKSCHKNGSNPGDCLMFPFEPSREEHYASYPSTIPSFCIDFGCPDDGIVLDPFAGSGTTIISALNMLRKYVGIEISEKYYNIINQRINKNYPLI